MDRNDVLAFLAMVLVPSLFALLLGWNAGVAEGRARERAEKEPQP